MCGRNSNNKRKEAHKKDRAHTQRSRYGRDGGEATVAPAEFIAAPPSLSHHSKKERS